jgi:hypothetical protein
VKQGTASQSSREFKSPDESGSYSVIRRVPDGVSPFRRPIHRATLRCCGIVVGTRTDVLATAPRGHSEHVARSAAARGLERLPACRVLYGRDITPALAGKMSETASGEPCGPVPGSQLA